MLQETFIDHSKRPVISKAGPPPNAHGMATACVTGQPIAGRSPFRLPDQTHQYYHGDDAGLKVVPYKPLRHQFDPEAFYMYDRVALIPDKNVLVARDIVGGVGDCTSLKQAFSEHLLKHQGCINLHVPFLSSQQFVLPNPNPHLSKPLSFNSTGK